MAVKDSKTEQQIKDAAKKLFFAEGRFNATTQEIADAAGVNRTLVNYYFRSRDTLFDLVLTDARRSMQERMESLDSMQGNLKSKIAHVIDVYMEQAIEYPFIDTYIVTRMNEDLAATEKTIEERDGHNKVKKFMKEIETEMEKGTIRKMAPYHFFINLSALMSQPICFHPMYKKLLNFSDKQYRQLIMERKQVILDTLFIK